MLVVIAGPINIIGPVKANTVGPVSNVILTNIIISVSNIILINAIRSIMTSVFKFIEAFKI